MPKFKFVKISKNKKIRYLINNTSSDIYVVFLHGFKSDLEGDKPRAIYEFCKKKKIGFLAHEYSGHGKSYGKFEDGTITSWTEDTKKIITRRIKNKKLILVGSSMGGWIGLNLFKSLNKKILAFVGIAPAPEFLERLMWKNFTEKVKKQLIKEKIYIFSHGGFEYNISYNLIKDGRKNKIFNKNFKNNIFLTILHGKKDDVVPISISRKILNIFKKAKKKLIIIKSGDHSLSKKNNLKKIIREIDNIYNSLTYNL
jgi:pimeloyl-ACP methyl ester carboxylesterase|tara:strand:+ start:455 stop:1219 length:765 start_codon:yes stop_codon:yes gene_type:complete